MKIKQKVLTTFLKKIAMNGPQLINECILNFDVDGLKIIAVSSDNSTRISGTLLKPAFIEYENIGKIGINQFSTVIGVIKRFGDVISLSKEGNLMTIKETNKKVEVELVDEKFITVNINEPQLEFADTFTISADSLHGIFDDAKLNDDAIITLETTDKKVSFKNNGTFKFTTEFAGESIKGGVSVRFGEPLVNAITNLDGKLDISVRTDYPAKIVEKTEFGTIDIIIAPRVDTNE